MRHVSESNLLRDLVYREIACVKQLYCEIHPIANEEAVKSLPRVLLEDSVQVGGIEVKAISDVIIGQIRVVIVFYILNNAPHHVIAFLLL